MTKNTPRLSTSSTSIKLFCLGIFLLLYLNLNASSIILHKSRNFISDDYDYDAPSRVDYKPSTSNIRTTSKARNYDAQQNDIDNVEEVTVNTVEKVADTTATPKEDEDDKKITNHYGQSKYSKNDIYKMIHDSKDGIAKKAKIAWLMRYVVCFCMYFVCKLCSLSKLFNLHHKLCTTNLKQLSKQRYILHITTNTIRIQYNLRNKLWYGKSYR